MQKKYLLKRCPVILLVLVLISSIFMPLSAGAVEWEEDSLTEESVYVSNLDWVSATHGDSSAEKTVQKDHPFTAGNENKADKISLHISDAEVSRTFDKGIGTVANSEITYSIAGAGYTSFAAFVGVDYSFLNAFETLQYGMVDNVQILVDDTVMWESEAINPSTPAKQAEFDIPDDANMLVFKVFQGENGFGDEVDFADAQLYKSKTPIDPPVEPDTKETFLNDLHWVYATHGDTDKTKTVQKNHPFTKGNQGAADKLTLHIDETQASRAFEQGLGTVGASEIVYNITGAEVLRFEGYIGVDYSFLNAYETLQYGIVDNVQIIVDGNVLWESGVINPSMPAKAVSLDVPENAKSFMLKCYPGANSWGDEVDFADVKFITTETGTFPGLPEKRMTVSNEHPLLIVPEYASQVSGEIGALNCGDTLLGRWNAIPDDLKPYTVMELHSNAVGVGNEAAVKEFYESQLEIAEANDIPIIVMVMTAGNAQQYTGAYYLTPQWADEMYKKYSCLKGLFSTESYWIYSDGLASKAAEYLAVSAANGGYFIWSEQNSSNTLERVATNSSFRTAMETYNSNFIFTFKNTPAGSAVDPESSSYMQGMWLAGYCDQWGGLMDTWKWYEKGMWRLFEPSRIPGGQDGWREASTEPEALLGIEMMNIYLNGGCVYNFENPAYVYGVNDKLSSAFEQVITQFLRYAIANPAPSKESILSSTKVIVHENFSNLGHGNFFKGLNNEDSTEPTYTTGRYGLIPAVPAGIPRSAVSAALPQAAVLDRNSAQLASASEKINYFQGLYPESYTGSAFAQFLDDSWYVYNNKVNVDTDQNAQFTFASSGVQANILLEPHTYVIAKEDSNILNIHLNNYRVDRNDMWENFTASTPRWTFDECVDFLSASIDNPKDDTLRTTTITISNLSGSPTISNVSGLEGQYEQPIISYDAAAKTAVITLISNGYVDFEIVL